MSQNYGIVGLITENSSFSTRVVHATSKISWTVAGFPSLQDLLAQGRDVTAIIADCRNSHSIIGQLQCAWKERRLRLPFVLIADEKLDPQDTLSMVRCGCFQCVPSTIEEEQLSMVLQGLRATSWAYLQCELERRRFRAVFNSLSPDEKQVAKLIVEGTPNKAIASRFDVSLRTIESRRARVFSKTGLESVCELSKWIAILEGKVISLESVPEPLPLEVKSAVIQLLNEHEVETLL